MAAAAGAQAFADAYLRNRAQAATHTLAAQLKVLAAKLRDVNSDLTKVARSVTSLPRGSAERTVAAHRQSVLGRQVYSLTLKYDGLRTIAVTPGTVISKAQPSPTPSTPSRPLYLGSGLFLGLLAGAGAAFGRDRLDTRLRTPADVERLTGLPLLAEIPARPSPAVFRALAAAVVASLGEGYHALLLERIGFGPTAITTRNAASNTASNTASIATSNAASAVAAPSAPAPVAEKLGAALSRLAPITVVTDPGARPDAALLLIDLRRATSGQVTAAVRHLTWRGAAVIGAVVVPAALISAEPHPVEQHR